MGGLLTMKGLGSFFRDNWYSLMMTAAVICGAVYTLGVQANQYSVLRDRVGEIKATQTQKLTEFEQVKDDMERIKWEASNTRSDIDQIKIDLRSIDKNVQQIDKRQEVIIELLKPRASN